MTLNEEGRARIKDGPEHYPSSVVLYCHFLDSEVRLLFSYLRQREDVLKRDLKRETDERRQFIARIRLQEVEAHLCFMCANFAYNPELSEKQEEDE